ncbi:MAG: hypothetical protein KJ597_02820 [Nanoarchaeota archaeon]|nr:hypothetical protein [Nanoarchaeota archaeon]MBU1622482.1 hypothetical protein [Nanoarchaeota archaeon]
MIKSTIDLQDYLTGETYTKDHAEKVLKYLLDDFLEVDSFSVLEDVQDNSGQEFRREQGTGIFKDKYGLTITRTYCFLYNKSPSSDCDVNGDLFNSSDYLMVQAEKESDVDDLNYNLEDLLKKR